MAADRLGQTEGRLKADRSWVTEVDLAVQEAIVANIHSRFPEHAVLAEEDAAAPAGLPSPGQAEYCWVIDPIDGTRNYVRGLPIFTTAIAVLRKGDSIVAATYDPFADRMYTATKGGGAQVNGKPVAVDDRGKHFDTMIGVPSDRRVAPPNGVRCWGETMVLRCTGSTALHLGLVASGSLDAAYSLDTRLWDVAGGALMVQEAGGVVTNVTGRPIFPIDLAACSGERTQFLAAGVKLHAELLTSFA